MIRDTGGPSVHAMMYATSSPPMRNPGQGCKRPASAALARELDGPGSIQYF
jgi:hypothetical protein